MTECAALNFNACLGRQRVGAGARLSLEGADWRSSRSAHTGVMTEAQSGVLQRFEERRAVGLYLVGTHALHLFQRLGVGRGVLGDELERRIFADDVGRDFLLAREAEADGAEALETLGGVGIERRAGSAVGVFGADGD